MRVMIRKIHRAKLCVVVVAAKITFLCMRSQNVRKHEEKCRNHNSPMQVCFPRLARTCKHAPALQVKARGRELVMCMRAAITESVHEARWRQPRIQHRKRLVKHLAPVCPADPVNACGQSLASESRRIHLDKVAIDGGLAQHVRSVSPKPTQQQ